MLSNRSAGQNQHPTCLSIGPATIFAFGSKKDQGDHGACRANYRCCLPALAGFVSPHSMGPGGGELTAPHRDQQAIPRKIVVTAPRAPRLCLQASRPCHGGIVVGTGIENSTNVYAKKSV